MPLKGITRTSDLPWLQDLHGNNVTIAEPMAEDKTKDLRACGCKHPHNQNVTQTLHSAHGAGRHLFKLKREQLAGCCLRRLLRE